MNAAAATFEIIDRNGNPSRSQELQRGAHAVIPGGAHTYSKGDDQYPAVAPRFIERGLGCHVWDVDGGEYIEYGMGLRAVTLGHGYRPVIDAAYREMLRGMNFTRPSPLEVECANELLRALPGADMVKFGKNGSDVTTAAVKLARAYTGRDKVAICEDQPFFSVDDWFLGTTAMSAGIPQAIRDLTVRFRYNDLGSLVDLFDQHRGEIACVVMEAATSVEPALGYLQQVKETCAAHGALLIFDEMITGFRWHNGGAQAVYGVTPDLSTFGKAIANGFAVSGLAGRREIMERGGLHHPYERVFLLSTTHGAETGSLAAALTTMQTYRREPIVETLYRQGDRLRKGVNQAIEAVGVQGYFEVIGRPCNLLFVTRDRDRRRCQRYRTLFMQEIARRGVIGPSFVISAAHTDEDVDRTVDVVFEALHCYRDALEVGPERFLEGPPVRPVQRSRN